MAKTWQRHNPLADVLEEDIYGLLSGILLALKARSICGIRSRLVKTLEESYDGEPVSIESETVSVIDERDAVVIRERKRIRKATF